MIQRLEELAKKLLNNPNVHWESDVPNNFRCTLGGSIIKVSSGVASLGARTITFSVLSSEQKIIDSTTVYDNSSDFRILNELWEYARAKAFKIDDIYKNILKELN